MNKGGAVSWSLMCGVSSEHIWRGVQLHPQPFVKKTKTKQLAYFKTQLQQKKEQKRHWIGLQKRSCKPRDHI